MMCEEGVGGGWGIVAQQNSYTALFWIICTSVNLCCLKFIRSVFHRQRAFLCMGKVHFSANVVYFISLSLPFSFLCAPFVCWTSLPTPPSAVHFTFPFLLFIRHIAVLFIRLSSSVHWHPMWEVYLWYRVMWRCRVRTRNSQHRFCVYSKVLLISVYISEQVCVGTEKGVVGGNRCLWTVVCNLSLSLNLSIIWAINQLNAQNLLLEYVYYTPLHVSSTMCSSSGGQNCIIQHLVSSHL